MRGLRHIGALATISVLIGVALTFIALSRPAVDEVTTAELPSTSTSTSTPVPTSSTSSTSDTTSTTPAFATTTTVDPATLPASGSGDFETAATDGLSIDGSPMIEFTVAAEVGSGIDVDELAAFVDETLADPRSWTERGVGFRRVADGGQFTLVVATPDTVDELCRPLRTNGIFSCARNGYIALNLRRWMTATDDWPADLETYRRYLVNHEVGHYVLGPDHDSCPGEGEPAPIMMQQTKGLDGCAANGWVRPAG